MGAGPAIRVKVKLSLEPDGPTMLYAAAFMSPGRGQSIIPKTDAGDRIGRVGELERFESFTIEGECWDALGNYHDVRERFDLRAYIADFKSGTWARLPKRSRPGEIR